MQTKRKVEVLPVFIDEIPGILKQDFIYISLKYMTATHLCLCGCGNLSVTPFTKEGWFLTDIQGKITISPSILNKNCPNKSHYVITKNIANIL